MGKVEIGIYYYLNADILTKVLQKCSLSSLLPTFSKDISEAMKLILSTFHI